MTDDIITITAGAPQIDIEPGIYEVTLTDISEPRTIFPQTGPNAGKEVTLRDWTFALEDGTEIQGLGVHRVRAQVQDLRLADRPPGRHPARRRPVLSPHAAHRPRGPRHDRDRRGRLAQDRQPVGPPEGADREPGRGSAAGGAAGGPAGGVGPELPF